MGELRKPLHDIEEIGRELDGMHTPPSPLAGDDRGRLLLSVPWLFRPADREQGWSPIQVPSFWDMPEQFDHARNWKDVHQAWYAAAFTLGPAAPEERVYLHCQGVSLACEIYVNGKHVGGHRGRFTPFRLDVTEALLFGGAANRLLLHVQDGTAAYDAETNALVNQVGVMPVEGRIPDPMIQDHPYFGGIWQPIWLQRKRRLHVAACKVETSCRRAEVAVRYKLSEPADGAVRIESVVRDLHSGNVVKRLPAAVAKAGAEASWPEGACLETAAPWADASLWSPAHPHLYVLETELYLGEERIDKLETRFGLREFWIDGGDFYLNGNKTRLFGDSLNMGFQMLTCFSRRDYLELLFRTLKQRLHVNCLRIHGLIGPSVMFEVADEVGLLLIDQSAIWSSGGPYYKRGGETFLRNVELEFDEWITRDYNHPSVVIWDVENEMVRGNHHNMPWVLRLDDMVRKLDTTRPIEHSGAGAMGGHSHIYHIHHHESYRALCEAWSAVRDKPLVLGEWWSGGKAGTLRNMTGMDALNEAQFYETMGKFYGERIMEWRSYGVSGVMPYHWLMEAFLPIFPYRQRIHLPTGNEMEPAHDYASPYGDGPNVPKELVNPGWAPDRPPYRLNEPVSGAFAAAFAPLAAAFRELWEHAWSGERIRHTVVVMNDTEERKSVTVVVDVKHRQHATSSVSFELVLEPGEYIDRSIELDVPEADELVCAAAEIRLLEQGREIYARAKPLWLYPRPQRSASVPIGIYGDMDWLASAAHKGGLPPAGLIAVRTDDDLSRVRLLILSPNSADTLDADMADSMVSWLKAGGRLICLDQTLPLLWFPVNVGFTSAVTSVPPAFQGIGEQREHDRTNYASRYAPVYAQGHPVFAHVGGAAAAKWRAGDARVVDDTLLKPFVVDERTTTSLRVLAGGCRQDYASVIECGVGAGLAILSQLKLADNYGTDPQATWLLHDMLAYADQFRPACARTLVVGRATGERIVRTWNVAADIADTAEELFHRTQTYDTIMIGSEIDWDARMERWLAEQSHSGMDVVLLERQPGKYDVLGNRFTAMAASDGLNALYFRRPHSVVWGLDGSDCEAARGPFVRYPLRVRDPESVQWAIAGEPYVPIVDVLTKSKENWYVHLPLEHRGYGMLQLRIGAARLTLCQLQLESATPYARYMLRTLLTNLGVRIVWSEASAAGAVQALRAEEVRIDANLEEWVCEVGDPNVSRWKHAQPILLDSRSVGKGAVRDNSDCSALLYMMWDDRYVYCAGHVLDDVVCPWGGDGDPDCADGFTLEVQGLKLGGSLAAQGEIYLYGAEGPQRGQALEGAFGKWKPMGYLDFHFNPDIDLIKSGSAAITLSGYAWEAAIPRELFGWRDRMPDSADFRVSVRDTDRPGARPKAVLAYPPQRKGAACAELTFPS